MPVADAQCSWRLLTAAGVPTLPRFGDRFVFHPFSGTLRCVRNAEQLLLQTSEGAAPSQEMFMGKVSDDDVEQMLRALLSRLGAPGSTLSSTPDGGVVRFEVKGRG